MLVIGLLFVYIRQVDLLMVQSYVLGIGYNAIGILIATALAYFLATKAWQLCFSASGNQKVPGLGLLFMIRQAGESFTLVNPTNIVGGEFSKLYFLKRADVAYDQSGPSVVISRVFIILSYLLIFFSCILFWFSTRGQSYVTLNVILGLLFIGLFSGVVLVVLVSSKLYLTRIISHTQRFLRRSWYERLYNSGRSLNIQLVRFFKNHKGRLLTVLALSSLHWLVGTLEFYFILNALEVPCSYFDALVLEMGVMVFKSVGGFVPGQIGIEEYGNKVVLSLIGVPGAEIWLAVSVLRRARQLAWIGISLIFILILYKPFRFGHILLLSRGTK